MNLLGDVFTNMRQILKTSSDASLQDNQLIQAVNQFVINDMSARIQLFDFKTKYSFQTTPGVDRYNMPLYSLQTETAENSQNIQMYPVYQGFEGPAYVNGIQVAFETQRNLFFRGFPNVVQYIQQAAVGGLNGAPYAGPYTLNLQILPNNSMPPNPPIESILRGHVDISGIVATGNNIDPPTATNFASLQALLLQIPTTSIDPAVWITTTDSVGNNVVVTDSGIMLASNTNYGMLIQPGPAPYGNQRLTGAYSTTSNTINYQTGQCTLTFNTPIPSGVNISAQVIFFQTGLPRSMLYYNNTITLRVPPSQQWLVELDAYLSPAAFLQSSQSLPFGYMSEYIAFGAARKILYKTGDVEQFMFYEPLFKEQEDLVWKRSQRQFTSTRTETLYSQNGMRGGVGSFANGYGITY